MAVYVAAALGAENVRGLSVLSSAHPVNAYWVPVAPLCGEAKLTMHDEPGAHCSVAGVV